MLRGIWWRNTQKSFLSSRVRSRSVVRSGDIFNPVNSVSLPVHFYFANQNQYISLLVNYFSLKDISLLPLVLDPAYFSSSAYLTDGVDSYGRICLLCVNWRYPLTPIHFSCYAKRNHLYTKIVTTTAISTSLTRVVPLHFVLNARQKSSCKTEKKVTLPSVYFIFQNFS